MTIWVYSGDNLIYSDEPWSLDYNTAHKIAKPPFPYVPGNELTVSRHNISPPPRIQVTLQKATAREREQVDVLTRCLLHPPSEGELVPQESPRLQILDTIRAQDGKTSQLVTVRVLSGGSSGLLGRDDIVAKFYDPLYYNHYLDDVDPFRYVNREYAREAAAYSRLPGSRITGIPEYYGSYSLEIPVATESRFVRLILIQKADEISMDKLDPRDLSLSQRQTIMKGILDIETQVYKHDVRNLDIHPRNVIVQNASSARPEIVIVAFGLSYLGRSYAPEDGPEEEQAKLPGTYISPLLRWGVQNETHFLVMNFKEWITWNWNTWLKREHKDDEVTDHMRTHWGAESTDVWPPGSE